MTIGDDGHRWGSFARDAGSGAIEHRSKGIKADLVEAAWHRKYDMPKCTGVFTRQRRLEHARDRYWIIAEYSAAPSSKHQAIVAHMAGCVQNEIDAHRQRITEIARQLVTQTLFTRCTPVGCSGRDDAER